MNALEAKLLALIEPMAESLVSKLMEVVLAKLEDRFGNAVVVPDAPVPPVAE